MHIIITRFSIIIRQIYMEKLHNFVRKCQEIIFQRIFLIQQHSFDSYPLLVLIFALDFITGVSVLIFCNVQISTVQFLQKYLNLLLGYQIYNETVILLFSIIIFLIIIGYLILCSRISIKVNQKRSKLISQDLIVSILATLTYLINALLIWLCTFAVKNMFYILKYQNDVNSTLIGVLGGLQFVFLVGFSYIYQVLFVNLSFTSFNAMRKYSTKIRFLFRLLNIFVVVTIEARLFHYNSIQVVCIALTICSFGYQIYQEYIFNKNKSINQQPTFKCKFHTKIFNITFHDQFAKRLSQISSICSFLLCFVIGIRIVLPLSVIQQNTMTIFIILTIFSQLALQSFLKHHVMVISMSQVSQLKSLADVRCYYQVLLRMKRDNSNESELIMMSLFQAHRINCINTSCFCKNRQKQLKTQIKDFSYEKWQLLQKQFCRNEFIMLMGKYFLYECFQYYPQIVVYLEALVHKQTSIQFNYLKYHLHMSITNNIEKKNQQKGFVETQGLINLQSSLDFIMRKMKQCAYSFYEKYKYLAKGLCRITEIQSARQMQLKIMQEIEFFYQNNRKKYKRSILFSVVLYFFFSKVFILNVRISQIRRHLINLRNNLIIANDTQNAVFIKSIYNNNCCAFESSLSNGSLGIIKNASKNATRIFGYQRKMIIGKNINKLMLSFMHQEHNSLLKQWYTTGRQFNLGILRDSFCVDIHQNIFGIKVYLKLHVSIDSEIKFIAMIKKQDNNNDLIVLNQKKGIEGFGDRIKQIIGFQSRKCPSQLVFADFEYLELCNNSQKELTLTIRGFRQIQYTKYFDQFYELKNQSILANKNLQSAEVNNLFDNGIKHHSCRFLAKKNRMGQKQFLSLSLLNVIENGYMSHIGSFKQNFQSVFQGSNFITKSANEDEKAKVQQIACESVNSSQMSDNYFIIKIVKNYFQSFIKSKEINSRRINITTIILFFLITLISAQLISVHYFYLIGLNSVYEVCFADGAVSDNMQLFEFLYGNSILMKQFENNTTELQIIHNSTKDTQNYVYELLSYDMEYLFDSVVSLTKLPYYQYMRLPIQWKFSHQSLQIQSYQFLEYYYYLSRQSWKTKPTQNILNSFMINFPQMKRINHQNLNFYADQTMKVIFWLNFIFYLNIGLLLIISIAVGYNLHNFYYKKYLKLIKCSRLYSLLSHQQLEELKNYYYDIHAYIITSIKENNLNTSGAQQYTIPITKGMKNPTSKLNIINNKHYVSFCWIIVFVAILNCLNLISSLQTQKIFQPSNDMVITMSQLMDSENYLIESYFQMKAYFIVSNQSKTINEIVDRLLGRIQYDELLFNIIAKKSLKLFKKYDPTYQQDFIDLLIDNICEITEKNLTDFKKWQCNYQMHENLIDLGVIGGMNQFYRQVQSSLNMIKTINISNFDYDAYFKSQTVRETDKNIFFMFKMYQTTQQRIMLSLQTLIKDDFNNRFIWLVAEILLVLSLVFYWVFHIRQQKIQIGNMYGSFLLIPQSIVAECKNIIRRTEEIMNDQ